VLLPPTTPLTDHVTVVLAVLVTLPTNATLVRHLLVIEVGESVTTTGWVEVAVPAATKLGLLALATNWVLSFQAATLLET
jgi:hypothetical protein